MQDIGLDRTGRAGRGAKSTSGIGLGGLSQAGRVVKGTSKIGLDGPSRARRMESGKPLARFGSLSVSHSS